MILILLLSILQTALACFTNLQSAKMFLIAACLVFVSQFLVTAISTMKNLGKLGNNLFGLFNFKNCGATKVIAMCAAEVTFFVVYYRF